MVATNGQRAGQSDIITPKERILAQAIVAGETKTQAFKKAGLAYDPEVLSRPRVIVYIEGLYERELEKLDYTVERIVSQLQKIADLAIADKQFAPAVSAIMGIAKLFGHLTDKSEMQLHVISKPSREPTKQVDLSVEEWQRMFAPKLVQ